MQLPVTVLTGFLGAGKTTLLNRLLSDSATPRCAVLVNEFGEIGVDQRLVVSSDDDIVELANGCVCCSVRGDLVRALNRLAKLRRGGWFRRPYRFERVLLETTGVAEPAPLLRTFLVEETVAGAFRLDGVVAVFDAVHGPGLLEREPVVGEQVANADFILLNKTDQVDCASLESAVAALGRVNRFAPVEPTAHAEIDATRLLRSLATERVLGRAPEDGGTASPPGELHSGISSVSLVEERPLDPHLTELWLAACVRLLGENLIRYKGILRFADEPRRVVLQGVYDLYEATADRPWQQGEQARTEVVFIGRGLDAEFLERGLAAAVA